MMDAATARQKYCDIVGSRAHALDQEREKEALKLLKTQGFYEPDSSFFDAAFYTACYGSGALMDAMLELGPVITSPLGHYTTDVTNGNLLHIAAFHANESVLKSLLLHATPAEINARNENGKAPLAYAILEHTKGNHQPGSAGFLKTARCLNALLDAGADPSSSHAHLLDIITTSAHPDADAFRKIVRGSNRLEIRYRDNSINTEGTALMLAMRDLPWPYVKAMIEEGANATVATDGKPSAYPQDLPKKFLDENRTRLEAYRRECSALVAEIAALPANEMLQRLTGKDGTVSPDLRAMLSLNVADPLASPDTWRNKPGGMEAGQEFARQLEMLIPENRSALKGRLDLLPYRRETETPREGSVLVAYARNTTPPREVS